MVVSDQKLVEALYENFPLEARPFEQLSKQLKVTEADLVKQVEDLKKKGVIKKFKVRFHSEFSHYCISCMVAWNIPSRSIAAVGQKISQFNEVAWCRQKPKLPDFPYNLYTMLYGKSREEIINSVRKISQNVEIKHHKMLWTEKEILKNGDL